LFSGKNMAGLFDIFGNRPAAPQPPESTQAQDAPVSPAPSSDEALFRQIAKAVLGDQLGRTGKNLIPESFILDRLKSGKLDYFKKTPGDCSTGTKVGSLGLSVTKFGSLGASSVGSLATMGALGTASTAIGLATFGVGLALLPLGFLFKHHAQAVAKEQATICQVSEGFSAELDSLHSAIQSRQITQEQANQILDQLQAAAWQALDTIYQECNASCYYKAAIKAIIMYEKVKVQRAYSGIGGGIAKPLIAFGLLGAGALAL
jgi:hypothetical protein